MLPITGAAKMKLTVVLVAILRDETPTVNEWVKHHVAMGIKDFVFIPNECSLLAYKHFLRAIPRFSSSDGVSVMLMPYYRCIKTGFQGAAYRAAADYIEASRPDLEPASTRLAFWDLDEFVVVRSNHSRRNFVESLAESAPETHPFWALLSLAYGTSGREKRPRRGSVQANFIERVPHCNEFGPDYTDVHLTVVNSNEHGAWKLNCRTPQIDRTGTNIAAPHFYKAICRLDAMLRSKTGVNNPAHQCLNQKSYALSGDYIRLNHYTSKSQEEFDIKAKRGRVTTSEHRYGKVPNDYSKVVDLSSLASFIMMGGCGNNESNSCSAESLFDHDVYPTATLAQLQAHCHTYTSLTADDAHSFSKAYAQACAYLFRAMITAPREISVSSSSTQQKSLKLIGAGLGITVSDAQISKKFAFIFICFLVYATAVSLFRPHILCSLRRVPWACVRRV